MVALFGGGHHANRGLRAGDDSDIELTCVEQRLAEIFNPLNCHWHCPFRGSTT
jgi:hypothetical protein